MTNARKHYLLWYLLSAAFVGVFLLPVIWPARFSTPLFQTSDARLVVQVALIILCPIASWLALAGEGLSRRTKLWACYCTLSATAICEVVHYWVVDRGHYFPTTQFADNTVWQLFMHPHILNLEIGALPHSYRFLPDAIVQVFTWLSGDFAVSRIAYRLLFNGLLFVAIYRYARTYVCDLLAGVAVGLVVATYPLTILKYAGQFVDPMSDLGFAACLLCLARRYEPGFGPNLFVALFAKEAAIVMAACRMFYGRKWWRSLSLAVVYGIVALAIVFGIRWAVVRGNLGYKSMSGMGLQHVSDNLAGYHEWILIYVAAFGTLLPGTILGWKYLDRSFRWTAGIVIASMLISSLMFSWMSEMRNMMPAFIIMAVANVIVFQRKLLTGNGVPSGAISATDITN